MNFALSCKKTKAYFDEMGADSQGQNDFTEDCRTQNICKDCVTGKAGKNGICKSCGVGLYQDQVGQTSCVSFNR